MAGFFGVFSAEVFFLFRVGFQVVELELAVGVELEVIEFGPFSGGGVTFRVPGFYIDFAFVVFRVVAVAAAFDEFPVTCRMANWPDTEWWTVASRNGCLWALPVSRLVRS